MITDAELLSRYAEQKSEAAFAELVKRHLNLVYSAALRQVGRDAHLAKDVTQLVFNDLARKADSLKERTVLAGWLYTSSRYAASQIVRSARRRQAREQEAYSMNETSTSDSAAADWDSLQPVLDEVMHELEDRDREAVLLRFFEGQPFLAVGAKLGLSEEAARKRVSRALAALRGGLEKRGVTSTEVALGGLLMTRAVTAAPVGFGAAVTAGALGSAAVVTGGAATFWQILWSAKALGSVTAATVVAGGVVAGAGAQRLDALRTEVAALRSDAGKVAGSIVADAGRERVRALEAELAALRQPGAAAVDSASEDPAAMQRRRLLRRTMIDQSYGDMFRRLALPAERLSALAALMLDREFAEQESWAAARAAGVKLETKAAIDAISDAATGEIMAKIRELLGAEKFAYYQTYRTTLPWRQPLMPLAEQWREMGVAKADEQVDALVARVAAALPDSDKLFDGGRWVIPDEVVLQFSATLTPAQVAGLKRVQAAQRGGREMLQLNREAAEKGWLRLSAQSAKDYPPPPGSLADTAPANERYSSLARPTATSLVSVTFKQEAATDALSLYRRLAGVELQIAPEVAALTRKIDLHFADLPPTAATMLLRQALLEQAGVAIVPLSPTAAAAQLSTTPKKS